MQLTETVTIINKSGKIIGNVSPALVPFHCFSCCSLYHSGVECECESNGSLPDGVQTPPSNPQSSSQPETEREPLPPSRRVSYIHFRLKIGY